MVQKGSKEVFDRFCLEVRYFWSSTTLNTFWLVSLIDEMLANKGKLARVKLSLHLDIVALLEIVGYILENLNLTCSFL